jgi:hypothetical protein
MKHFDPHFSSHSNTAAKEFVWQTSERAKNEQANGLTPRPSIPLKTAIRHGHRCIQKSSHTENWQNGQFLPIASKRVRT